MLQKLIQYQFSASRCAAKTNRVLNFRTELRRRKKQTISEHYLFLRHSSVQKLGPIFVPAAQLFTEIVATIFSATQRGVEMGTCICFFSTPRCRKFEQFVSSALLGAEITTPQVIVLMGLSM